MAAYYLWFKGLHIAFMVTWFAGLFYLPRLFIYHVQASDETGRTRFQTMEKRLFAIMTIGAILTSLLGIALIAANPAVLDAAWFHWKIALVAGLIIYHYRCWVWIQRLKGASNTEPDRWLRWFNEIPVIFLLGIILLAVLKPM